LDAKLKPWINRKLKEYLGEEEPKLVSYILKELANKISPFDMYEKIKVIFDADTDVIINFFVLFNFK
jgi:RNA-binding protein 25